MSDRTSTWSIPPRGALDTLASAPDRRSRWLECRQDDYFPLEGKMSERFPVIGMKGPEGPQPSGGTVHNVVDRLRAATWVASTVETVIIAGALAAAIASSAGPRYLVSTRGGANCTNSNEASLGRVEQYAALITASA